SIATHTAHSAPLKAANASSTRRRSSFPKTAAKTRGIWARYRNSAFGQALLRHLTNHGAHARELGGDHVERTLGEDEQVQGLDGDHRRQPRVSESGGPLQRGQLAEELAG